MREQPRLRRAPQRRAPRAERRIALLGERVGPALLDRVDHDEVDKRLGASLPALGAVRFLQWLEAVLERVLERHVEHVEQLSAAAEVVRDPGVASALRRAVPVATEHLHVGVPERVDRLVRVADREQVVAVNQRHYLGLQAIRVLKLVDHHVLEAVAVALAQGWIPVEQVAGQQLKVLEVEPRALVLHGGEALVIEREQLAQKRVVARLAQRDAGAVVGPVRLGEPRERGCVERLRVTGLRLEPRHPLGVAQLAPELGEELRARLHLGSLAFHGHAARDDQPRHRGPQRGLELLRLRPVRRNGRQLRQRRM